MTEQNFGYGQAEAGDGASQFNSISFIIEQALAEVRTVTLVKVVAVTPGGTGGQSRVDCQPLVNLLDGAGNSSALAVVFDMPVFRLRSGNGAVVVDPVVGDIGMALVSDRDISAVKSSEAAANPGSLRKFDLSDSVYLGGVLGGAETQYVNFTANGLTIADKNGNKIEMKAGSIDVTTTAFRVNGTITAGFGGVDAVTLQQHIHPANGSPPTPGH